MSKAINLNDGTHSRFDDDHCKVCQDCHEAYVEFLDEQRQDEQLDAVLAQNNEEEL